MREYTITVTNTTTLEVIEKTFMVEEYCGALRKRELNFIRNLRRWGFLNKGDKYITVIRSAQ